MKDFHYYLSFNLYARVIFKIILKLLKFIEENFNFWWKNIESLLEFY